MTFWAKGLLQRLAHSSFTARRTVMTKSILLDLPPSNPVRLSPHPQIILTDVEEHLCTLLDDFTRELKQAKDISTSCRVAGGWVRDKLLGLHNQDIDIAVEDMMGLAFATDFIAYAESKGIQATAPAVLKSNPEQSKHLETTKIKVFDIEIDVVNLRSEEYAEVSRIPTDVKYGTPLEDALRRDLTINALFYNVHTRSVEDHTGRGMDDLRKGLIRTPVEPTETFRDDPLRLLRAVRFASRYGFKVVPEIVEAAKSVAEEGSHFAKISRERVGEEFDKMMKGPDPLQAIQLINALSLYQSTFCPPEILASLPTHPASYLQSISAATILQILLTRSVSALPPVHPLLLSNVTAPVRARLFLGASLTPFRNIHTEKEVQMALKNVIREGLKLGTQNHYLDGVPLLFRAVNLLEEWSQGEEPLVITSDRVKIGLLLRDAVVHNPFTDSHWTISLLFSLVQDLLNVYDPQERLLNVDKAAERIAWYNDFVRRVEELNLMNVVDARPILDGHEVSRALGVLKPGPWLGKTLPEVVKWQLKYPEGTKEECVRWLEDEWRKGNIDVDEERSLKRAQGNAKQATKRSKK